MLGLMSAGGPMGTAAQVGERIAVVPHFANLIAFRTDDGLVLVDTGVQQTAQVMFQAVRGWTRDPVRYTVFTHGHIDHVFGLGPFDEEAREQGRPAPIVLAHEAIGQRFERYAATAGYNGIINSRQFGRDDLVWPTEFRRPDVVYRDTHELAHGGLTFRLRHALGETDDHTWVFIPELKALCPGDLFVWVSPNAGNPQKVQRYPAEWAAALREMAEVQAELLLPSHGPPIFGADRVHEALVCTAEYLESLVEQTIALMNSGARLDEAVHAVRPPGHLAAKPYLQPVYDEPEFIVRNVWRRYGGWYDGNPAHLKPAPEADLAAVLAQLAGGSGRLVERALTAAVDGDLRLATDLVEIAALAADGDPAVHAARAQLYAARAAEERSLMAKGIYRAAAADSARVSEDL